MDKSASVPTARPGQQGPGERAVEKSPIVQIAGIWSNRSKGGEWYGRGATGNVVYLILPNTRKKKPTEPDYQLCITKRPAPKDNAPAGTGAPPPEKTEKIPEWDPATGEALIDPLA